MYEGEKESLEEHCTFVGKRLHEVFDLPTDSSPENPSGRVNIRCVADGLILPHVIVNSNEMRYLEASTQLTFICLQAITKPENIKKGAILLLLKDKHGNLTESWMPKRLCANIDITGELGTVYVWTPFLEENRPELLA